MSCRSLMVQGTTSDAGKTTLVAALAMTIASSFCEKPTAYAASRFRNGPKPEDFGMKFPRLLPATTSGGRARSLRISV